MANILVKCLKDPKILFFGLGKRGFLNWLSDKAYIKLAYRIAMGKRLNLRSPKTFNEKLQWLKLYDRQPIYTTMVDKYEAKRYIAQQVGESYIVPNLGIWDSFDDIDFDSLPDQFVLKTTHDSGGVVICTDKSKLDMAAARAKLEGSLRHNYYAQGREWPYKNVKPRILAEQFMEDTQTGELRDYKFFCFDGEVKALFVASERQAAEETKFDFFDAQYHHLPFTNGHPNADVLPQKPACFEEMKELAGKLSVGIPHLRVDFYEVNGKVYFGELTFSHWSGMMPFQPEQWDETFGSWIDLPADRQ